MNNIQDKVYLVLQQIDAALAQWEKEVTPGPWTQYITDEWPPGWIGIRQNIKAETLTETHVATVGRINEANHDAAFIASSRTQMPKLLAMMRTAIEGLRQRSSFSESAEVLLATLCDQWEAKP